MKSEDVKVQSDGLARIDAMKTNLWIGYEKALSVRASLDTLLRHPKTHRMPNIALIGDTNNGKTMILKNFCKRNNPVENLNDEKTRLPILFVQTPPAPDEGRLYFALLEKLSVAGSVREPEDSKLRRLHIIMKNLETRMLLLDDFFNIGAGTPMKRKKFLNALRNLANELQIPIVVSGTPETLNVLSTDPSLSNRFTPVFVPKWNESRFAELASFILSIEKTLLLKGKVNLLKESALRKLCILGEGLLGEMVTILRLLAELAIRTGTENIEEDMLTKANLLALGWVMPSDRSRHFI